MKIITLNFKQLESPKGNPFNIVAQLEKERQQDIEITQAINKKTSMVLLDLLSEIVTNLKEKTKVLDNWNFSKVKLEEKVNGFQEPSVIGRFGQESNCIAIRLKGLTIGIKSPTPFVTYQGKYNLEFAKTNVTQYGSFVELNYIKCANISELEENILKYIKHNKNIHHR